MFKKSAEMPTECIQVKGYFHGARERFAKDANNEKL